MSFICFETSIYTAYTDEVLKKQKSFGSRNLYAEFIFAKLVLNCENRFRENILGNFLPAKSSTFNVYYCKILNIFCFAVLLLTVAFISGMSFNLHAFTMSFNVKYLLFCCIFIANNLTKVWLKWLSVLS